MNLVKALALWLFSRVFRFWIPPLLWFDGLMLLLAVPSLFIAFILRPTSVNGVSYWLYALPFTALAVLSVVSASVNFDQPLLTGIITESRLFYPIVILAFLLLFPHVRISEHDLLLFSSMLLFIYTGLHFGIRANLFTISNETVIGFDPLRGGERVRLNLALPVIMAAYLIGKASKSLRDYIFIMATLAVVLGLLGGRVHIVALLLPLVVLAIARPVVRQRSSGRGSSRRNIFVIVALTISSPIVFLIIQPLFSSFMNSESLSGDFSVIARLEQLRLGAAAFSETNLLGMGKLSESHRGGFASMFGYFHFEDLGVIGVLFVYGLFGIILYFMPILGLIYLIVQSKNPSIFMGASSFLILYMFTGEAMLHSGLYFIVFWFLADRALAFSIMPRHNWRKARRPVPEPSGRSKFPV